MARRKNRTIIKEPPPEGIPHLQAQAPPKQLMLPPVVNVRGFQYRLVDEQKTGEGDEIRMDLFHPLLPIILVFPFDRLVFASFVRECSQLLAREDEGGE